LPEELALTIAQHLAFLMVVLESEVFRLISGRLIDPEDAERLLEDIAARLLQVAGVIAVPGDDDLAA